MKNFILELSSGIRNILKERSNIIILLLVSQILLTLYVYVEILDSNYHFYMNTKTSLETIHNIKIDSYNGAAFKQLSTEEQLIRKQNKKFHLYKFLKL